MKKLTTLTALLLISMTLMVTSCGKGSTQASIIQAYYLASLHTFNSAGGMYIYPNYSTVQAAETGTNNTISITYTGINTGIYDIGPTYSNSIIMSVGGKSYSSLNYGSYGRINMTKFDAGSMIATGNYSGTLINNSNHNDSLHIASGVISVKYQF